MSDRSCPGERWGSWPSPAGLALGILGALSGQVLVIGYHYVRLRCCAARQIQKGTQPYRFWEGVPAVCYRCCHPLQQQILNIL